MEKKYTDRVTQRANRKKYLAEYRELQAIQAAFEKAKALQDKTGAEGVRPCKEL